MFYLLSPDYSLAIKNACRFFFARNALSVYLGKPEKIINILEDVVRSCLLIIISSFFVFSFSAQGSVYVQAAGHKVDVKTDLSGASIDGTGFGGRIGYRWSSLAVEGGYTTATAKLKGQIFSPSDSYKADFSMITAGVRWWLASWFDLSGGILSTSNKIDMSLTVPGFGTMTGNGKYSSTGYYIGAAIDIPVSRFDIFVAYNMYRWSEKTLEGSLAGAKSDTGINTIAGGLRVNF